MKYRTIKNPPQQGNITVKNAEKSAKIVKLIGSIRRELPPVGKPILDKKRLSKVDLTGRKAKHKSKDI